MPEQLLEHPQNLVLAVDLDGTLISSDMLFETLWAALSRSPSGVLSKIIGSGSRAQLKRRLAEAAGDFDVSALPYNREVIAYIERWRAGGGRTVLVTASDAGLADRIAAHLGLFDEVHGSDGERNLKGEKKAAFLTETYGRGGYVYVGDAAADLPVWAGSAKAVTVNAGSALRAQAAAQAPEAEHLTSDGPRGLRAWLKALRLHQWLKNVLVFVPMLTGHALAAPFFFQSLLAFICFSLIASGVYLMNDLLDLAADRAHPRKRKRPLAAGTIPIGAASFAAPGFIFLGMALGALLEPALLGVLVIYFIVTTAYSLHLKRLMILDIWVLAILYSLRIVAGSAATGLVPSIWLMAFSIFFFFSLAAVKRLAELVDLPADDALAVRRRGYTGGDTPLIAMMAISSGYLSILVMALYIRTPFVERLYGYPPALFGICLVLLYWVSRIVMLTHRGQMHDDPLVFAVRDRTSLVCLAGMLGAAVVAAVMG